MQAILRRLLDRLDAIAEQHGEVGDTAVRDAMSDAVFDGFLRPVSALQDVDVRSAGGSYFDDYLGWANLEAYDASGAIRPRHDA
jgi:hypothetical protein